MKGTPRETETRGGARRGGRSPAVARRAVLGALGALLLAGCDDTARFLRERMPLAESEHERYARRLEEAGLGRTTLGRRWLAAADSAPRAAEVVATPFRESGYFAPGEARATAYWFTVKRGQRVTVVLATQAEDSTARLFADLFARDSSGALHRLASMPRDGGPLAHEARTGGELVLRLQPELLTGVRYTVTVRVGASLRFPVAGRDARAVRSLWGAARDGGRRSHQGVDIFAPRGTPVMAAAPGVVTNVGESRLGGRVVWVGDARRGLALYYAHLDVQLAREGERVRPGDTLGLVGNTGNARTTPPHLHFGIYRRGRGAIDPYPFIAEPRAVPAPVTADLAPLGTMRRIADARASRRADVGTVLAARADAYVVRTPDGATLVARRVAPLAPTGALAAARGAPLRARPDARALVTARAEGGAPALLGQMGKWCLVRAAGDASGWVRCEQ